MAAHIDWSRDDTEKPYIGEGKLHIESALTELDVTQPIKSRSSNSSKVWGLLSYL